MKLIECMVLDDVAEAAGPVKEVPPTVKSLASKAGVSVDRALGLWKKAGRLASEEFEAESERWWKYKVGIFKRMLGLDEEAKADFVLDLTERLSDTQARERLNPGKSVLIKNAWWTIKSRDLASNKVTLQLSDWSKADGYSGSTKSMPFSSLVKGVNQGKIGVRIDGTQHGPAQDAKKRDKVRQKSGLPAAPGAAKYRKADEDCHPYFLPDDRAAQLRDSGCGEASLRESIEAYSRTRTLAERVKARNPDAVAWLVAEAVVADRFAQPVALYKGRCLRESAGAFVKVYGSIQGTDAKSQLSWIASVASLPANDVNEAHAKFRAAGCGHVDALLHTVGAAFHEFDLEEAETRSEALMQFVLMHDGKLPDFEAWLREEHPDLSTAPEALYEAVSTQRFNVPGPVREAAKAEEQHGVLAMPWQDLVRGDMSHQQVERMVHLSARDDSLPECAVKWGYDVLTKTARLDESKSRDEEDRLAQTVSIPAAVRARVRSGLMEFKTQGIKVTETELKNARRLCKVTAPYAAVRRLAAKEQTDVFTESGKPTPETVKHWMRGGNTAVRWARKVVREIEG